MKSNEKRIYPVTKNDIFALKVNFMKMFVYKLKNKFNYYQNLKSKGRKFVMPFYSAGFSLIEIIIYIAIFGTVSLFAVNIIFTTIKAYNNFKIVKDLKSAVEISLERMSREIQLANNIDISRSILSVSPGKIYLNTVDFDTGSLKTVEFFVSGGAIAIVKNGLLEEYLTSSSTEVLTLVFREIVSSTTSKAIKIEMDLRARKGGFEKSEKFYTTAILKNSY